MAKFITGGKQTTINSTITELFPALAFNNKKVINDANAMEDYIVGLSRKKSLNTGASRKAFVDGGDVKSAYTFIDDISSTYSALLAIFVLGDFLYSSFIFGRRIIRGT